MELMVSIPVENIFFASMSVKFSVQLMNKALTVFGGVSWKHRVPKMHSPRCFLRVSTNLYFCFLIVVSIFLSISEYSKLSVLGAAHALEQPHNFVWIIADDMSPDIAAYGAQGVFTPNLDALAAGGKRYTRAYASAPVCSSSRSAFILGCYQTTTGLHAHDVENPQPLAAPYEPLPTQLRKAGWFVTNAAAPGSMRNGRSIKAGKTHYNFAHTSDEMFDGDDFRKRKPGQPFFAQFQITEPHRPFPIPLDFDESKIQSLQLPKNYPDHPLTRRDWYAYQRSVEVVDQRVGAILEQLKSEGVLDNTIVMFFADHGRPMPWGKQWLNVEGLQVPLIISGPGVGRATIEERCVSLIDLAPTVLQLAKRPVPAWMEGEPILNDLISDRKHVFAARDRCGDAQDRIRAMIGIDLMLVRNFSPDVSRLNWSSYKEESYPGMPLLRVLEIDHELSGLQSSWLASTRSEFELYDLKQDPNGIENVVQENGFEEAKIAMQSTLEKWIKTTGDRGALPDSATEPPLAEIQKNKREGYNRTWLKRLGTREPADRERLAWWQNAYGLSIDSKESN